MASAYTKQPSLTSGRQKIPSDRDEDDDNQDPYAGIALEQVPSRYHPCQPFPAGTVRPSRINWAAPDVTPGCRPPGLPAWHKGFAARPWGVLHVGSENASGCEWRRQSWRLASLRCRLWAGCERAEGLRESAGAREALARARGGSARSLERDDKQGGAGAGEPRDAGLDGTEGVRTGVALQSSKKKGRAGTTPPPFLRQY